MSNQALERRTPMQDMVERVGSDEFKQQAAMALPPTVSPERFVRIAITALLQNGEQLAKCEPNSVYRSLLRAAQDGLLPDGKEAALVAYNTKIKGENGGADRWETRAQYLPMVGGLRKVLGEHGWTLTSTVIREADEFEYELGETPRIILHRAPRPGVPRGEIVGAYAQAKHADGRVLIEVMDRAEIDKVRATSRSADRGPWKDWFERMAEKTPAKRLAAKVPLGEMDERVIRVLTAVDTDPAEATAALYGGTPAAQLPVSDLPAAGAGTSQPADGGEADPLAAPPSSAAGALIDDEPSLGAEPQPNADEQALLEQAAVQAAMFTMPSGKHRDKTLGEIAQIADSDGWFLWVLRKADLPPAVTEAAWAFCRAYKPALFQQVLAEREASAA